VFNIKYILKTLRYSVCDNAFASFIISRKGFLLLCLSGCEFIITTISLELVKHAEIISSLYNEKKQVILRLVVDHSIKKGFPLCSFSNLRYLWREMTSAHSKNDTFFYISSHKTTVVFHTNSLIWLWHLLLKQKAVFLDI
jgi:hypothetical protein